MRSASEIESQVVGMYERYPFPSIADKQRKAEEEMDLRLYFLGITAADYEGKKILDAGCGTGEYSCWYARRGADVIGVDLCESSLRQASEYAGKEGLHNIRFEKGSVLKLNFPDASFDYVYSMGVLHHTPDPYGGFRELCRVLRPNGVIIISLYNKFGRFRHNMKQLLVRSLAGDDIHKRVAWAQRLFPGTCRALKKNREQSDVILYDAFGIPHESQHSIGEVLKWFDRNKIDYLGAFGPATLRDNLRAFRRKEIHGFKNYFKGFSFATGAINTLSWAVDRFAKQEADNDVSFSRPPWFSRGLVQACWFLLGFKFSIFSLAGRKVGNL